MLNQIKTLADTHFADAVRIRRQLHAHPELAFEEYQTAQLVKETLEPLGIPLQTGIAKTGLVAVIEGKHAGPTFCLRADMDALPIVEENAFDFASQNKGKMHACGHDGHTASLLTTAKILHALRDDLHGTARLIFQPSEERIPGGAKIMIEEGVLDADAHGKPQHIFGQHVAPELPVGTIGVRGGMYMASTEEIYLTIHGQGGHGAAPHKLAADPVLVAAHVIIALQSVISRNCPPDVPSVLTFGKVVAEGATNVIPNVVRIEGTFRAMNEEWRFRAHDLIRRVAENTALAFGATCEANVLVGYPYLYNDPQMSTFVREQAVSYVGEANTIDIDLWFAAEDFAWYLQQIPGVFYRLGTGSDSADSWHGLHTPRFTLDEESLRIGSGFMAHLALMYGLNAAKGV
jgi:hippurate hydrolase